MTGSRQTELARLLHLVGGSRFWNPGSSSPVVCRYPFWYPEVSSVAATSGRALKPRREDVKSPVLRSALGGLLTMSLLLVCGGCENHDGNHWQRVVCEVQSVNAGQPLVSAFLNAGSDGVVGTSDDFVPIDSVPVTFHARPYGSTIMLPEDGAHSWFQVTSYDLVWENPVGVPVDLTPHNVTGGGASAMVPVYEEGGTSVLVVGIDMKNAPWFVDLYSGDIEPFQANANLTFHGHESGSDKMVQIHTGLRVHFIPVIVQN
jgi:hypothetical protein